MDRVSSVVRIVAGTLAMTIYVVIWFAICIPLLPSRTLRIKACNYFGKVAGSSMMMLSGCHLTFAGMEHLNPSRPALYISNHTSIFDLFLGMWLAPIGTVGIAKKQVVWYPLLGQLYLLSGHLLIDRGNTSRAVKSLIRLGNLVYKNRLSIWMWPEGTRSRTGRLLPFKKGIVHLALQTKLPIVPVIVSGAHRAWEKNTLLVRAVPIQVHALPAVETTHWTLAGVEEHLAELHRIFQEALPGEQKSATV